MAWIESHQELADHPKTRRLMRLLGLDRYAAIGLVHVLWYWALDYADDGDLSGHTDADVADGVRWERDAAELVAALTAAGFLNADRTLHDWYQFAGRLIQQREANAERQARWRERHRTPTESIANASPNASVTVTSASRNGATGPNRTGPDLTGPEPEDVPLANASGRAAPAATPPAVPKPDRLAQVIDLIRAEDLEPNLRGQDTKAVKDCRASPADIAATYVAIAREEFGDDYMFRKLSIATACAHVDGWRARRQRTSHPPPPDGFLGASPRAHATRTKGGIFG